MNCNVYLQEYSLSIQKKRGKATLPKAQGRFKLPVLSLPTASKPTSPFIECIHKPFDRTIIGALYIRGETASRELSHSAVIRNTFATHTKT